MSRNSSATLYVFVRYIKTDHENSSLSLFQVELKVNKMASIHTQLPYDYYALKFCKPRGGVQQVCLPYFMFPFVDVFLELKIIIIILFFKYQLYI